MMLSNQDMLDILKIGHTVQDCRTVNELRETALLLLETAFHCDSANFFLARHPDGKLDLNSVITRGITGENLARFNQYYYRLDPFLKWFPPRAAVTTMDQVAPGPGLLKSEYYNDFLKPQAIRHQLTLSIVSRGRILGVVALFKPLGRGNFTGRDRTKADLLAPFLAGALERTHFNDQATRQRLIFEIMAAKTPWPGVMIVDENLRPIYCNQGARDILPQAAQGPDCLLPESISTACRKLMDRIPNKSGAERKAAVTLPSQGRNSALTVNLSLVDQPRQNPLCLISLGREGARDWSLRFKEKGISKRELEVINLVARGMTNTEVGRELYISENTVENHLKSIYRKLGVKNRASLINQMMEPAL